MSSARSSVRLPARTGVAAGITLAVLAVAVAAGTASATVAWGPLVFAESLSARISGGLFLLGTKVPLGYAFVAGMVASVNPCGFVLLPAYLGLYLGDDKSAAGAGRLAGRAVLVSATMTASFVRLFGIAGLVTGLAASAVTSALPWTGIAVGAGLVLLGGVLATGRELGSSFGPRAAQHLRGAAVTRGISGYAAYGVAYGLASLGCTLPGIPRRGRHLVPAARGGYGRWAIHAFRSRHGSSPGGPHHHHRPAGKGLAHQSAWPRPACRVGRRSHLVAGRRLCALLLDHRAPALLDAPGAARVSRGRLLHRTGREVAGR